MAITETERLESAIQKLRDANPSPEAVEKLAADTQDKRDNPHTFASLFVRDMPSRVVCQLCGMFSQDSYVGASKHPAVAHVDWHNALHRAGVSV